MSCWSSSSRGDRDEEDRSSERGLRGQTQLCNSCTHIRSVFANATLSRSATIAVEQHLHSVGAEYWWYCVRSVRGRGRAIFAYPTVDTCGERSVILLCHMWHEISRRLSRALPLERGQTIMTRLTTLHSMMYAPRTLRCKGIMRPYRLAIYQAIAYRCAAGRLTIEDFVARWRA